MQKNLSIVISLVALAVSVGSLVLSYLGYRSGFIPPQVSTRLNEFVLTSDPISVAANFDFSLSNHSSRPLFIVKCEVATDGLNRGGGGYGERYAPCGIEEFETAGGLELAPGQTEFFTVNHTQDLDSYDSSLALDIMGIDLDNIRDDLSDGPCVAELSTRRGGASTYQNCALMESSIDSFSRTPSQQVFVLSLQTGTGELIRTPVYLSINQPWSWGK